MELFQFRILLSHTGICTLENGLKQRTPTRVQSQNIIHSNSKTLSIYNNEKVQWCYLHPWGHRGQFLHASVDSLELYIELLSPVISNRKFQILMYAGWKEKPRWSTNLYNSQSVKICGIVFRMAWRERNIVSSSLFIFRLAVWFLMTRLLYESTASHTAASKTHEFSVKA